MSTIWYVSKYAAVPDSKTAGTRGFMIMREIVRKGHRCLILTSDSNHLLESPQFDGPQTVATIDGVDVCWIRTLNYE